jgi:transcriptional regulator with XRE-family HTH domain
MDSEEELAAEEARWAAMGRHLRRLRDGQLQETLAEKSGVSVPTIRAIENHPTGRRHTPRTLKKLSRALGKSDDYLGKYLQNPPPEESAAESEATNNAPPPQSALDLVVPRLDEILVNRLNELVVPRLQNLENQVRVLTDISHNTGRDVEMDVKHVGDAEQPP